MPSHMLQYVRNSAPLLLIVLLMSFVLALFLYLSIALPLNLLVLEVLNIHPFFFALIHTFLFCAMWASIFAIGFRAKLYPVWLLLIVSSVAMFIVTDVFDMLWPLSLYYAAVAQVVFSALIAASIMSKDTRFWYS